MLVGSTSKIFYTVELIFFWFLWCSWSSSPGLMVRCIGRGDLHYSPCGDTVNCWVRLYLSWNIKERNGRLKILIDCLHVNAGSDIWFCMMDCVILLLCLFSFLIMWSYLKLKYSFWSFMHLISYLFAQIVEGVWFSNGDLI